MVRALALVELMLVGYLFYLGISLFFVFLDGGMLAVLIELLRGTIINILLAYTLVLIIDIWRDKKREKLIIKGKLSPDRLF
jgi:K+ transporter